MNGPPVLTLKRTKILRVVAALGLGLLILLAALGAVAGFIEKPPEPIFGAVSGAVALILTGLLIWIFLSERNREVALYDDRIVQRIRSRVTEIPWASVEELRIKATRVQAGGLVGLAVGAAVEAATKAKNKPLNENTTSIQATISGGGSKIKLTSNDKGVVAALDRIQAYINPRLTDAAIRQIQQGGTAMFGPLSLSLQGVSFGKRRPVLFGEIGKFYMEKGKLYLKKNGSWLASGGAPVAKVPNPFVALAVYRHFAGAAATAAQPTAKDLVGSMYV